MSGIILALRILLPIGYAVMVLIFGEIFFRPGAAASKVRRALPLVLGVLIAHAAYIGLSTVRDGHCLVASIFELSSLIAFTLLAIYAFVELRVSRDASGTAFLVAVVAFIFQLTSSLFGSDTAPAELAPILKDPVFNIHVTTAVFGYAALSLSMIYGSLYLVLFRSMRRNEFGAVFEHLPSLDRLERYGIRATAVGFVFLTISIALGGLLLDKTQGASTARGLVFDPKILATILVWLVFGTTLVIRRIAKIEGRKLVLFWMYGFVLTIVSMTVVNAFVTSFHNFL